jgi:hypothetical protein
MATILTKKKDTTGAPVAGDLTNSAGGAELAVNTADKRLYTKDSGGNVVEIGTNPTSLTAAGTITAVGSVTVSGTSSSAGSVLFFEDTDNGTNKATVIAPAALGADVTLTLPATTSTLGYQNVPAVGTKTGSYTLATTDIGKYVQVGTSGSITIPDATFAEGDVISIFNNTTGNVTITCTITTAYIAGTDADKASVTLATRGVATILFISGTVCVISGNVS